MEDIIATTAVKIWEVHGTVNFKLQLLQLLQIKRGTLSDWCASFLFSIFLNNHLFILLGIFPFCL